MTTPSLQLSNKLNRYPRSPVIFFLVFESETYFEIHFILFEQALRTRPTHKYSPSQTAVNEVTEILPSSEFKVSHWTVRNPPSYIPPVRDCNETGMFSCFFTEVSEAVQIKRTIPVISSRFHGARRASELQQSYISHSFLLVNRSYVSFSKSSREKRILSASISSSKNHITRRTTKVVEVCAFLRHYLYLNRGTADVARISTIKVIKDVLSRVAGR